ncbi:hypothetical protein [Dongia deserti]|uniref:hypothetical protein n=1 Tax=Dongia deserti TaxID=2268030 RepID=UPI000E64A4D2|nr:hypothetical protein [Dongia deserti]
MARTQAAPQTTGKSRKAEAGARTTTDHDEIRKWVETRSGKPAKVADTDGRRGSGILRVDFGEPEESLMPIGWDEFFQIFDDRELAFLHEEETNEGKQSYFNKFISRGDEG